MKNSVQRSSSVWICSVVAVVTAMSVAFATSPTAIGGETKAYPPLPKGITSFGAAVAGDWLYVYGGHFGRAHHYSNTSQSNELSRLNLKQPTKWKTVAKGPRLQGLAMVAHDGKLYRVGGFTAHNDEGEEHDLRSVADFARFDPKTGKWENLPPMPVPRSSHDAVVIGDKLYVAGGWAMGDDSQWHNNAFVVDLAEKELKWKQLPAPPFKRRAISLGEHDGKLYVMGGMQEKGGPTTRVAVFDPSTEKWTEGPKLNGEGMVGFGSSAFKSGGKLFVSTYDGKLQCLDGGGAKWRVAKALNEDRFFHRMLPYHGRLYLVGGASMQEGKRLQLEVVDLSEIK
jgi:N-acetylneuraminic acid mutarotase